MPARRERKAGRNCTGASISRVNPSVRDRDSWRQGLRKLPAAACLRQGRTCGWLWKEPAAKDSLRETMPRAWRTALADWDRAGLQPPIGTPRLHIDTLVTTEPPL